MNEKWKWFFKEAEPKMFSSETLATKEIKIMQI